MGTVVIDEETGLVMKDLTEDGEAFVAAKGGKGGKGNTNFKNSETSAKLCGSRRFCKREKYHFRNEDDSGCGTSGIP